MKTTHRNYSEEQGDFNRLAHFFTANPFLKRSHSTWCLGRIVDWKYALYENKRAYAAFCEENAHLWFDGYGELVAFVVSESGDSGFHIATLPGYRFLYEELLHKKGGCHVCLRSSSHCCPAGRFSVLDH